MFFHVRISSQHMLGLKALKGNMGVGGKEGRDRDGGRRKGGTEGEGRHLLPMLARQQVLIRSCVTQLNWL